MLHKLLLTACLFAATNSFAQVSITPVKTTEKPADPQIDYKQVGAPLPLLRIATIPDTSKNRDTANFQTSNANSEKAYNPFSKVSVVVSINNNSASVPVNAPKHHRKIKKQSKEAQESQNPRITPESDFNNGANLFVMMFNPTCSHCQDETEMVEKNISLFNKSKWVFVANPSTARYLPDFIKQMHINNFAPFYIGIDSSGFLNKVFEYRALPQINIYDGDRKLVKTYNGEVPIDSLKKYIE